MKRKQARTGAALSTGVERDADLRPFPEPLARSGMTIAVGDCVLGELRSENDKLATGNRPLTLRSSITLN
jgi:hypothetical protein